MRVVTFDMDGVLIGSEPCTNAAAVAIFGEFWLCAERL